MPILVIGSCSVSKYFSSEWIVDQDQFDAWFDAYRTGNEMGIGVSTVHHLLPNQPHPLTVSIVLKVESDQQVLEFAEKVGKRLGLDTWSESSSDYFDLGKNENPFEAGGLVLGNILDVLRGYSRTNREYRY
jgi:hypothetical protein